jgi:hypothetical protein
MKPSRRNPMIRQLQHGSKIVLAPRRQPSREIAGRSDIAASINRGEEACRGNRHGGSGERIWTANREIKIPMRRHAPPNGLALFKHVLP